VPSVEGRHLLAQAPPAPGTTYSEDLDYVLVAGPVPQGGSLTRSGPLQPKAPFVSSVARSRLAASGVP